MASLFAAGMTHDNNDFAVVGLGKYHDIEIIL